MVNPFARQWAAVLNRGLRRLMLSPQNVWHEQVPDLKAIAGFLLQVEAQLSRARVKCLRNAMTMNQLRLLWQQLAQEVQQALHEAALHTCLPDSWLAQRVLDSVDAWNADLHAISRRPLEVADLLDFQCRLEAMADNLYLYVLARQDRWEDIAPPR